MQYTVKEIAEQMGLTEHTLRFYTDRGLLPCNRDKNNRRVFDEDSINWLEGIKCLRKCGVSIEDIKAYSDLCLSDTPDGLQNRYAFMLKQRENAMERLKEAQELADYMIHKVRHYEDILSGKITDDTNPAKQKLNPCD
ncbi:MerR family transcriptional regulator [Lacrimispora brassicae]